MFKGLILVVFIIYSASSLANVDIDLACKEKKEQQRSLLERLSTSMIEAYLAGQCTGYDSYYKVNLKESCNEFLEQKESLLGSLSTSLKEAHMAGMCVGAIYKVARGCKADIYNINYAFIARGDLTLEILKQRLECDGNPNGQ